jgi:hypothetical protein
LLAFLIPPIRATCHCSLVLVDFIVLIIAVWWRGHIISSLCGYLRPLVTSSHQNPVLRHLQSVREDEIGSFTPIYNNR